MDVEFRPLRESDREVLADLLNRVSAADGKPMVQTGDELAEEFESHGVQLEHDTLTAWSNASLVAATYTTFLPSSVRNERCYITGGVDPQWRGSGIGRQIMSWSLARAEAQLTSSNNQVPRYIRMGILESNKSEMKLAERFGLRPVHWSDDLHRPLGTFEAAKPVTGIEIIGWDLAHNESARLAKNSAFEDHWGSTPNDPDSWAQMTTGFGSRLDLSFLAIETRVECSEVVGLLLTHRFPADDALLGKKYALIDKVAVLRSHRGRGIATALISHALNAYRADSLDFATLDVDADSPTGAHRLYSNMGFVPLRRSVTYEREVRGPSHN